MNISIETLVTVTIAVLVAGIIGIAVSGESSSFLEWGNESTSSAECSLAESQFANHAECDGSSVVWEDDDLEDRIRDCGMTPDDIVDCD